MDNLINIKCLDKENIISQLKSRYNDDTIYTKIDNILLAVNPFKNVIKKDNSPHPDDIADTMLKSKSNESVLISGESGAGKTETTKILLNRLLKDSSNHSLSEMIIASNIIMESFGNASTIRNHNSSRFGKLISLYFEDNKIVGSKITTYLLEKIRVTNKDIAEKNFHIFYLMTDMHSSKILNTTNTSNILFDGDSTIDKLYDSFKIFDIYQHIDDIKKILEIIVLLSDYKNNYDKLSELLVIDKNNLINLIEKQTIVIGNETILKELSDENINVKINTLSQELYNKLFEFIVSKINLKLSDNLSNEKFHTNKYKVINLLDIFGFESLQHNSIEQLCINYTNEILQNEFNKYFFKKEQELYISEGLPYDMVDFVNNDDIILCLEKTVFGIINEVTKFIKPKDDMIIEKLFKQVNNHIVISNLEKAKGKFNINHYASMVLYNIDDMIIKNNLNLSNDIINIFNSSKNKFIDNFKGKHVRASKNLLLNNFYKQIKELQNVINKTNVNFIRCIKPNSNAKPNMIDDVMVGIQLTYNGIIEAIMIARQGYPIRYPIDIFYDTFRIVPEKYFEDIIIGKTMVFLKNEQENRLNDIKIEIMNNMATVISKNVKRFIYQNKFNQMKNNVIIIQKIIRGFITLKKYKKLKSIILLQSYFRMINKYNKFNNIKNNTIIIQKFVRNKFNKNKNINDNLKNSVNIIGSFYKKIKTNRNIKILINCVNDYIVHIRNKKKIEKEEERKKQKLLLERNNMIMADKDSVIFNSIYRAKMKEIENNKIIEHLNKERDILLDAIATKDIKMLKRMAEMEERMIMMQNNMDSKQSCNIM